MSDHEDPPLIDLLIVGAGPAGLSAAVAALHRGATRVLVVEQSRTLREIGRNLDLMPNQIRTLCALSPEVSSLLSSYLIPREKKKTGEGEEEEEKPYAVTVEADGTLLQETRLERDDAKRATLPWWKLQRTLLDALSALTSQKILVLNHQLVSLQQEQQNDCVVAEFLHDRPQRDNEFRNWNLSEPVGEDESARYTMPFEEIHAKFFSVVPEDKETPGRFVKCRARMVVGADGVNSVTRREIYASIDPTWLPFAAPQYTTLFTAFLRGHSDMSVEERRVLDNEYMHNDATYCKLVPRKADHNRSNGYFRAGFFNSRVLTTFAYASVTATADATTLKSLSSRELMEMAIENARQAGVSSMFLKYCRSIADLLSDDQIVVRPFFVIPANHPAPFDTLPDMVDTSCNEPSTFPSNFRRPWFHKRVVLIGDAAHAAPNFIGQGAGMAVEDAYELVVKLKKRGLLLSQPVSSRDADTDLEEIVEVFEQFRKGRLDRNCSHQRLVLNPPHDAEEAERGLQLLWNYFPKEGDDDDDEQGASSQG